MSKAFDHPALQQAHWKVIAKRHRFVDFQEFIGENGPHTKHYLILGTQRNAYDVCHRVAIYDHSHHPYPEQVLIRPYLAEITRLQGGEYPVICSPDLMRREAPFYFKGPGSARGELAYVDLDAAFWQIYAPASLDLDYDGKGRIANGQVRFLGADELSRYKLLRNAVIGTARTEWRTDLDYGTARRVAIAPTYQRPALWAYVMDILECVAWDARLHFGAVHVYADGYIFRHADLAEDFVSYLHDRWGLAAGVRARGKGLVSALGSWRIGDVIAGLPEAPPDAASEFDNMSERAPYDELRGWFLDAQAYRAEKKFVQGIDREDYQW